METQGPDGFAKTRKDLAKALGFKGVQALETWRRSAGNADVEFPKRNSSLGFRLADWEALLASGTATDHRPHLKDYDPEAEAEEFDPDAPIDDSGDIPSLGISKAAKMHYQAEREKLYLAKQRGDLIERSAVEEHYIQMATQAEARLREMLESTYPEQFIACDGVADAAVLGKEIADSFFAELKKGRDVGELQG